MRAGGKESTFMYILTLSMLYNSMWFLQCVGCVGAKMIQDVPKAFRKHWICWWTQTVWVVRPHSEAAAAWPVRGSLGFKVSTARSESKCGATMHGIQFAAAEKQVYTVRHIYSRMPVHRVLRRANYAIQDTRRFMPQWCHSPQFTSIHLKLGAERRHDISNVPPGKR